MLKNEIQEWTFPPFDKVSRKDSRERILLLVAQHHGEGGKCRGSNMGEWFSLAPSHQYYGHNRIYHRTEIILQGVVSDWSKVFHALSIKSHAGRL